MGRFGMGRKKKKKNQNDNDQQPIQTPKEDGSDQSQSPVLEDINVTPDKPKVSEEIDTDKTKEILKKVDAATKTMELNIDAATQRGESIGDLQDKTQAVAESSKQFSRNAKTVKSNLWYKNMRMTLIIAFILIIVIGIVAALIYFQS